MRIVLFGRSGSGKSTCASIIREISAAEGLTYERIGLAEPLYWLQRQVYDVAGVPIAEHDQDQLLLEALASQLRRINEQVLVNHLRRRLATVNADVVINDDLRDPYVDAPALREAKFTFIRVACSPELRSARLAARMNLTVDDAEPSAAHLDLIEPDLTIRNDGTMTDLRTTITEMLRSMR